MNNQHDVGAQEDFDNMTYDLGRVLMILPREDLLTYESQTGTESGQDSSIIDLGVEEVIFMQVLDKEHEMVASGQMDIATVRLAFMSDSIIKEEDFIYDIDVNETYKVLKLTKVGGQSNDVIIHIKGFGKKVPNR